MGKVWIPTEAGMSGWRGFVFFRSFLHTLGRGNPDFAKLHGLRFGQSRGPRVRGDERVERPLP
jgi:hypothetical protein